MPSTILTNLLLQAHSAGEDNSTTAPAQEQGRRACSLGLANAFFALPPDRKTAFVNDLLQPQSIQEFHHHLLHSRDIFDFEDPPSNASDNINLNLVRRRGVIVRTDFSDDEAWIQFCGIIRQSEKDGLEFLNPPAASNHNQDGDPNDSESDSGSGSGDGQDHQEQNDSNTTTNANGGPDTNTPPLSDDLAVFILYDPPTQNRPLLLNASNLKLLRLFSDINIEPTPPLPSPNQRDNTNNRLIDWHGYRETYQGRLVWAYDTASNTDASLRCISSKGRIYGAATGDSWRAKGRSAWELQLNMDAGTITLDFHPDMNERRRNLAELRL